jgi:tetratricopeptide (TPR) repeat protein
MLLQFTLLILFGQASAKAGESKQEAYFRANKLFTQGRLEQSLEAVNDALRLNPNFVPALTLRAKLSMAFNRLAEAGRDLNRAVEIEPHSAYNQFMLGFYYYLENDFKRALEPLNRSAELDEANSRTYFYLALTHEGLANASMAIQLYEKAIALDREKKTPDLDTLIAFARLLFSLGQYEKCLSLVEQALSLDSKSRDAHYERGRLYLQAGDFKNAIQHGEQALVLQSPGTTDRQIHFLLARAYARAGNQPRADEHLAKFEASAPSLRR